MATRKIRTSAAAANDTQAIVSEFTVQGIRHAADGLHGAGVDAGILRWMDINVMDMQGRTARSTKSPKVNFSLTKAETTEAFAMLRLGTKLMNEQIAARYAK